MFSGWQDGYGGFKSLSINTGLHPELFTFDRFAVQYLNMTKCFEVPLYRETTYCHIYY
jgi:hypothetical protein